MQSLGGWMAEICYFYRRIGTQPLSPKAQVLWHYLMYRANVAFWQFPVVLHLGEIAGATEMSLSATKRARQELETYGYIVYQPRGGCRAAEYFVISNIHPLKPISPVDMIPEKNIPPLLRRKYEFTLGEELSEEEKLARWKKSAEKKVAAACIKQQEREDEERQLAAARKGPHKPYREEFKVPPVVIASTYYRDHYAKLPRFLSSPSSAPAKDTDKKAGKSKEDADPYRPLTPIIPSGHKERSSHDQRPLCQSSESLRGPEQKKRRRSPRVPAPRRHRTIARLIHRCPPGTPAQ